MTSSLSSSLPPLYQPYLYTEFVGTPDFCPGTATFVCRKTDESFAVERELLKHIRKYGAILPEENETCFIPEGITAASFGLLIEYMRYYLADTEENREHVRSIVQCMPLDTDNIADRIPEWYANFLKRFTARDVVLFDLLKTSTDLGVDSLKMIICAYVASLVKLKTPDQIMEVFGFTPGDFTEEEIAEVKRQTKEYEEQIKMMEKERAEAMKAVNTANASSSSSAGEEHSSDSAATTTNPSSNKAEEDVKEIDDENDEDLLKSLA